MNLYFKKISIFVMLFSILSCSEDLSNESELLPLVPDSQDESAGEWENVMGIDYLSLVELGSPDGIESDVYRAELENLASITKNRTEDQESKIKYWKAGGVVRWNQILRDLVGKYNVAPPCRWWARSDAPLCQSSLCG